MDNKIEYYNTLMGKTKRALSDVDWNKKYLEVISKLDKLWETLIDLQAMPQLYRKKTKEIRKWLDLITIASNNIWDAKELLEKYNLYRK